MKQNEKVYLLTIEYKEGSYDFDVATKVYAKHQDAVDELRKIVKMVKAEYGDNFNENGEFVGDGGIWCCEEDETSFSIWEDGNYNNSHYNIRVSEENVF